MKYQIRPMEDKDIPEVIAGEERAFGESLGFDMLYQDLKLNPFANYLVLEIDGQVGGYIGLWITEDTAEIINFYVEKEYQGYGYGQMLLDFAMSLCLLMQVESLSLEVREKNVKAIRLYEKNNFIFSHKRIRYYEDGEDALVMIKKFEV